MSRQLIAVLLIPLVLITGTALLILYGRGYRLSFVTGKPEISGTGLLVTKSVPDGAEVFINGHLTTATDNTLNLVPGEYTVKIHKEGYFPWEKTLKIQKEVVAIADALLFPMAPKLDSITASGAQRPVIDPSLTRIAYVVASQSARKNGIYVLDLTSRPILTLQSTSTQLADDTFDIFSNALISWSPDGRQLIATISAQTTEGSPTTYLLNDNGYNATPQDITATIGSVGKIWEKELTDAKTAKIATLQTLLRTMVSENFTDLVWSPDETRVMYTASRSATLPIILQPRMIGSNSTPEERDIKEKAVYVYDIKEDRNYKIVDAPAPTPTLKAEKEAIPDKPTLAWLYDSKHILYSHSKRIEIMDYDGLNTTIVYAGPFTQGYVFPYPNNPKFIILTDLGNPSIFPNLYTIGLK